MSVFKCLNNSETQSLECLSEDGITSLCTYRKNDDESTFQILNDKLYLNSHISELNNTNLTDSWILDELLRINNCFNSDKKSIWNCKTMTQSPSYSYCFCCIFDDDLEVFDGYIATKSLYKGFDNMIFPTTTM